MRVWRQAAECLNDATNGEVDVVDGGVTQGAGTAAWQQTEKLLIMDAIDFGMAPGFAGDVS